MGKTTRLLLIGFVLVVVGAALLLWVDPFGWHVWQRWMGGYDAAITAVPANSQVYIGLNLLNADRERLNELAAAFDPDASQDGLEQLLVEEWGLSLEEDILTWIGQYVGVALLNIETAENGSLSLHWVAAAELLDPEAADLFLEKWRETWIQKYDQTAETRTYKGIELIVFSGQPELVFGRSDNLVLFGSDVEAVQQAIDTQGEESLADSASYQEATAQLPANRLLTFYTNGDELRDALTALSGTLSLTTPGDMLPEAMQGTAVSFSLVNAGVQLDTITLYDADELTPTQQQALTTQVQKVETAAFFPANTPVYAVGQGLDLLWGSYRDSFIAQTSQQDFTESMQLFADEFGLNPDTDLFPLLDGEAAFGLIPGTTGLEEMGLPVGGTAVIHTNDPAQLTANLEAFSQTFGNPQTGIGTVTTGTHNGFTTSQIESVLFPGWHPVYTTQEQFFVLGSDLAALQALVWDGGPSLAAAPRYQQTWQVFPADFTPGLYIDMAGLVEMLQTTATDFSQLKPITTIAMAGSSAENRVHQTLVVFIQH